MFNKPLQQKYGRQHKLNYTSIPSAFSLAKKLYLMLKHRNCRTRHGSVMFGDNYVGKLPFTEFRTFLNQGCPDSAGTGNDSMRSKMASKKRKLEEDQMKIFPHQTEKRESREMLIYIIPKKIPKARLQVLNNLAQRKGFPITEKFR